MGEWADIANCPTWSQRSNRVGPHGRGCKCRPIDRVMVPCWWDERTRTAHLFAMPIPWPFVTLCGISVNVPAIESTVYPPHSPGGHCAACLKVHSSSATRDAK